MKAYTSKTILLRIRMKKGDKAEPYKVVPGRRNTR
jgi:hypothetical protein